MSAGIEIIWGILCVYIYMSAKKENLFCLVNLCGAIRGTEFMTSGARFGAGKGNVWVPQTPCYPCIYYLVLPTYLINILKKLVGKIKF